MKAIEAARLFDGATMRDRVSVVVDGPTIREVAGTARAAVAAEHLPGDWLLVPGFIDLQVNGGGGIMFNDGIDAATLARIASAHARAGTTTILPTLISGSRTQLRAAQGAVATAVANGVPGIAGLHLEGPFLALTRRGIHPPEAIIEMTDDDAAALGSDLGGCLLVTLAPETVRADLVRQLAARNVIISAGHSDATCEQAQAAFAAGVAGVTHLFNAMSQFGSRAPGLVGATLADTDVQAGIIVDGIHVHPASVAAAYRAMGATRLFLVSDAMATAGSDATSFVLGGQTITLRDGRLTGPDGTLGGAHLTMAEAVRNAVTLCGIPIADALRMATATPAMFARLPDRGRIAAGMRADLVALDADLRVVRVWQSGPELRREPQKAAPVRLG